MVAVHDALDRAWTCSWLRASSRSSFPGYFARYGNLRSVRNIVTPRSSKFSLLFIRVAVLRERCSCLCVSPWVSAGFATKIIRIILHLNFTKVEAKGSDVAVPLRTSLCLEAPISEQCDLSTSFFCSSDCIRMEDLTCFCLPQHSLPSQGPYL